MSMIGLCPPTLVESGTENLKKQNKTKKWQHLHLVWGGVVNLHSCLPFSYLFSFPDDCNFHFARTKWKKKKKKQEVSERLQRHEETAGHGYEFFQMTAFLMAIEIEM